MKEIISEKKTFAKVVFTLLFALLTTSELWAETDQVFAQSAVTAGSKKVSDSEAENTDENVGVIKNVDDWNNFAAAVANDEALPYYILEDDLDGITTTVGTVEHRFKGQFDGKGHKLTVAINNTEENAAPFSVVSSATISNLTVEGTIQSTQKFAGGIVGKAYGKTKLVNCVSKVELISDIDMNANKKDGDATYGGLVGRNMESSTLTFTNCFFYGLIRDIDLDARKTIKCAGFLGWNAGQVSYTNCLQAGKVQVSGNTATFHRGGSKPENFTNTYYITDCTDAVAGNVSQGEQAPTTAPDNQIVRKYTFGETDYFIPPAVLSEVAASFPYTEKTIVVEPSVTYLGEQLEEGTDYIVSYKMKNDNDEFVAVDEIKNAGEYQLIVTGQGNYAGQDFASLEVVAIGAEWADLQAELEKGGVVIITSNYTAGADDEALTIKKNVTLDLNGHTISRGLSEAKENGYVILVKKYTSLTITDSSESQNGLITGGYNSGNGGGIYIEQGTLKLQGGTIANNKSLEGNGYWGTGGGVFSTGGHFYMTGGTFSDNYAQGGGGGVHAINGTLCITGGTFTNNIAGSKGGAIRTNTANAVISNCTIIGNTTTNDEQGRGAGIYMEKYDLTLTNCVIKDNNSKVEGGGIFVLNGTLTANNCTITGNESPVGGCVSMKDGTYIMNGGIYKDNVTTTKNNALFNVGKGTFELDFADKGTNVINDLNGSTPSKVTLSGRTLWKDNDWNTLCLPFDIDNISSSVLAGADIRTLSDASLSDAGELSLTFTPAADTMNPDNGAVTSIKAGTPYLIKWAADENIENPEFTGVTIKDEKHDIVCDNGKVTFMGNFDYRSFDKEVTNFIMVGTNNSLFWPSAGASLGAMRAYIQLGDGEDSNLKVKSMTMNFDDTTSIREELRVKSEESAEGWYDLNGRKIVNGKLPKGLYIHNGKKVMIY